MLPSPLSKESQLNSIMNGTNLPFKPPIMWAHGVLHWSLTAVLLYLGFDCFLPGDMMTQTNAWGFFLRWMPEQYWGFTFITIGGLGVLGAETTRMLIKLFSVFVLATSHILIALMFLANNPNNAGAGIYSIFAVQGYYLLYRYTRPNRL